MDYLEKVKKMEDKLYSSLWNDELESFEEQLSSREELYRSFSKEAPEQFGEYLSSEDFKNITVRINKLYEEKREAIRNEMSELARSRKAAEGYIGTSVSATGVYSKSV